MGMPCFIGIDQGTEQLKVGVFRADGEEIYLTGQPYETRYPHPGWAEQDPLDWWEALKSGVIRCLEESGVTPDQIKALSIAATSATVLCVDETGTPLADAIIWMDVRSYNEVKDIDRTGHEVLKYAGGSDSEEWMVPKALWIKKNRRDLYDRSAKIVESLDWLNYKLTGKWTASLCNVTNSWNYVPRLGGWRQDFFEQIGLEEITAKWPSEILPIGNPIGSLENGIAKELGLSPETMVVEGAVDAHMGMLGMNVVDAGKLALTLGTSNVHLLLSREPIFAAGLWGPYQHAIVPDLWLTEGGQTSGAVILKWLRDNLSTTSEERDSFYDRLNEQAGCIAPGSEGLVMLDTWQGNRTPWRDTLVRGALWGLNLQHTTAHIYRAAMESIAFGTRNIVETMAKNGGDIKEIVVSGGAARNRCWLKIFADVCRLPISVPAISEATIFGAGVAAAVGAGYYPDIRAAAAGMVRMEERIEYEENMSRQYDYNYCKYIETYYALKGLMHEMVLNSME